MSSCGFCLPVPRSTIRLRYSGEIEEATSNAERQRLEAQLVETDRLYEEAGKQVSITADERIRLAAEHERLEAEVARIQAEHTELEAEEQKIIAELAKLEAQIP